MNEKSSRNKTLSPLDEDTEFFQKNTLHSESMGELLCGSWQGLTLAPRSVDLLIADPPYNKHKSFKDFSFKKQTEDTYEQYTEGWLLPLRASLKEGASLYICCDWQSSSAIFRVLSRHFTVLNRITWEREKGRGALHNWKNGMEDIWFAVAGKNYTFNADAVRLKKKVLAPYRDETRKAKDWQDSPEGRFRLTGASNIWTDITVPYWSMAENTPHPTQKPEKLLAKLILASSNEGDTVLDPFCGSGSTLTAAKKLGRRFIGSEIDPYYASLARRRLILAESDRRIQGYEEGLFKERNS